MSDNIPFEIQTEIIKLVPDVKSLIRFRAVSKPWKSFIDTSEFIVGYRARKTQPHSSLLRYTNYSNEVKYLSVNNDTFTQQQDLAPNVSALMKQFDDLKVIGYSRGLLCLYAFDKGGMFVLWNPTIRRSVGILAPGYFSFHIFGFAVCPVTYDPTIIKISFPWKIENFTLSSKIWTVIQCSKPRESITLREGLHVVIDSCIYRVAYETIRHYSFQHIIISFDLNAKEFKAIDLPNKITNPLISPELYVISKLKGSLVVIVPRREVKVWKMEPDCSFTHLFTINSPDSYISHIVGFRKNGELLVETEDRRGRLGFYGEATEFALEVYDPCSQHINNLGFSGRSCLFFISSYKETLLLLDHSDSCVYPEIN